MAEIKRNFLGSKMNISLDDRLVPPGEYRLAWNVNVSLSENSDVGALENVRGNQEVFTTLPTKGPSYEDIGVARDSVNDRVYWFFVGPQTEGIYEFDLSADDREFLDDELTTRNPNFGSPRNIVNRIVEFSKRRKILNLQTSHLITGADIIDNLLYWTDGLNPPRKINIERFRGSGNLDSDQRAYDVNFNPVVSSIDPTHDGLGNELQGLADANLFVDAGSQLSYDTPFVGDYLSVAKRPPLQAPMIQCPAGLDENDTNGPGQDADGFITQSLFLPEGATQIDLDRPFRIPDEMIELTVGGSRVDIGPGTDWLFEAAVGYNNQLIYNGGNTVEYNSFLRNIRDPENEPLRPSRGLYLPNEFGNFWTLGLDVDATNPLPTDFPTGVLSNASLGDNVTLGVYDDGTSTSARFTYRLKGDADPTDLTPTGLNDVKLYNFPFGQSIVLGFDTPANAVAWQATVDAIDAGRQWRLNLSYDENRIEPGTEVSVRYIPVNDSEQTFEPSNFLAEKFISFAYRYRYRDGEVSAISPFSEVAFLPRAFDLDLDTSELISMRNRFEQIEVKYNPGSDEVTEVEIIASVAGDANLYSIVTLNKEESSLRNSTPYADNLESYTYRDNKVYRVLPSDQLTRIYDNVPLQAKAQQIIGNRLVYGNYVENYDLRTGGPEGHPNTARLVPDFTLDYKVTTQPEQNTTNLPARSVKTDRDYEVGIVYLDREGRQTPAITSENNSTFIPFIEQEKGGLLTDKQLKLTVDIRSEAPWWATHYRFFVKQSSLDYYNMYPLSAVRGINTASRNIYLRIDSSEINKYRAGDTVLLKSIEGSAVTDRLQFRVDAVGQNIEDQADTPVTMEEIADNTGDVAGFREADYPTNLYVRLKPIKGITVERLGELFADDAVTNGVYLEGVPTLDSNLNIYYEYGKTFRVFNGIHTDSTSDTIPASSERKQTVGNEFKVELEWSNCYTFWNGVEETRVRGGFNEVPLPQGIKATTVQSEYRQVEQESGLIHSGIYNDDTGLNRLNEFNPSLPITWEVDISDGSIQKLHGRNTNLVVFQEDKVKRIPINKNLIQSAGGGEQLTTSSRFFNTEQAYPGNYGISLNPESFASYGDFLYFADKNRGVLCSLHPGNGQIVEISKQGVEEFVRESIRDADVLLGFYDDVQDQYNISFKNRAIQPPDADANFVTTVLGNLDNSTPRAACNRNHEIQSYETFYGIAFTTDEISIGDAYYTDSNREIRFNGWNAWYTVRVTNPNFDPNTRESSRNNRFLYNQAIQINQDGLVTSIENDCAVNQLPITRIEGFGISSIPFSSEFEACAIGIVDTILYHNGAGDEPDVRDLVYETIYDEIPSTRDGWYLMTEGRLKYVIRLDNGEVINKIDCRVISAGRTAILGSGVLRFHPVEVFSDAAASPLINNTTIRESFVAGRNVLLCQRTPIRRYYFESEGSLPEVGDILYDQNFNTTTQQVVDTHSWNRANPIGRATSGGTFMQPEGRDSYVLFANGIFVRINEGLPRPDTPSDPAIGEILEVGLCSEYVCYHSPNELFDQNNNDPFRFTFLGITDDEGVVRGRGNVEIYYTVQGTRQYPEEGEFVYRARVDDGNVSPLEIRPMDEITLPRPSDSTFIDEDSTQLRVVMTRMCYRGIGASNAVPIYRSNIITGNNDDRFFNALELTPDADDVGNILYIDPDEAPTRFYNSNLLGSIPNNVFNTAGRYALSEDPDLAFEYVTEIDSDGFEVTTSRVFREAPYVAQLAYHNDDLQDSCTLAVTASNFMTYYTDERYVNDPTRRYTPPGGTTRNLSRWSTDESAAATLPDGTTAAPAEPISVIHLPNGTGEHAPDGFYTGYTDISDTTIANPVGDDEQRVVRQVLGGTLLNDSMERCEIIPDPTQLSVNGLDLRTVGISIPYASTARTTSVTATSTTPGATFRWQTITGATSVTGRRDATLTLGPGTYNVTANSGTTLPTTTRVNISVAQEIVNEPTQDPVVDVLGGYSFRYVYDLDGDLVPSDIRVPGPTGFSSGNEGANFRIPTFGPPVFREPSEWVVATALNTTVTLGGSPVPSSLTYPGLNQSRTFIITTTGNATRVPGRIPGCPDPTALNYNSDPRVFNDGSCVFALNSISTGFNSSDPIRACRASGTTVYSTATRLGSGIVLRNGSNPNTAGLAGRGYYSNGSNAFFFGGGSGNSTSAGQSCGSVVWRPQPTGRGRNFDQSGTLVVTGGSTVLTLSGSTNFTGGTSGAQEHTSRLDVNIAGVGDLFWEWDFSGGTSYNNLSFGGQPVVDLSGSAGIIDRFNNENSYNRNGFARVEPTSFRLSLNVPAGTYNWTSSLIGNIPIRYRVNASQPS